MFPWLEIPQGPNPFPNPFPPPNPFDLGECSTTPVLSCLAFAAIVELTFSCGRSCQWTTWQRPLSAQWSLKLQQMEASSTREYYSPGQRGDWGLIMYLFEWVGRVAGERWREVRAELSFYWVLSLLVWLCGSVGAGMGWVTRFPWCGWCLRRVCFGPFLVISRWSYPLGQSTKGECWFLSTLFSALGSSLVDGWGGLDEGRGVICH